MEKQFILLLNRHCTIPVPVEWTINNSGNLLHVKNYELESN